MRSFIISALKRAKETGIIEGTYKGWKGNVIDITETVKDGLADFEIIRSKVTGERCSGVPVYKMPLEEGPISYVADLAVENL